MPEAAIESEATLARETGWVISNFLATQAVFVFLTIGTAWPSLHTQTEVVEGMMLLAIIIVPVGFLILYPLIRISARPIYRRHANIRRLAGSWLPGTAVAMALFLFCKLMGALQKVIGW